MTYSKTLKWTFVTIVALLSISFYSCRKANDEQACCDPTNPDCPNYDPCYGVEEPSAEFLIKDFLYNPVEMNSTHIPEQEIFKGATLVFESSEEESEVSHTWYIGADEFYESSVEVDFTDVPRPATITVSHIIEYPIDSICFPMSSGRDSVARTFHLIDYLDELNTIGRYRGVLNQETDSFDVQLLALTYQENEPAQWGDSYFHHFINLHNNGDTAQQFTLGSTNSLCFFSYQFEPTSGSVEIDPETKEFVMTYEWAGDEGEHIFRGRVIDN
jgi:hypothetical protein